MVEAVTMLNLFITPLRTPLRGSVSEMAMLQQVCGAGVSFEALALG